MTLAMLWSAIVSLISGAIVWCFILSYGADQLKEPSKESFQYEIGLMVFTISLSFVFLAGLFCQIIGIN